MKEQDSLDAERKAFDYQIIERTKHGHVPDLRYGERNEWFYNNVWRDPEYVRLSFVENIDFLTQFIKPGSRIVEIGCGPGHLSLEFARRGHHVTAFDLSPACIQVAEQTLAASRKEQGFGSLSYFSSDFLRMDIPDVGFDAALFYGALSHFPDLEPVLDKVYRSLTPSGRVLVWDTCVESYTTRDASFVYAIRALLSLSGHYFQKDIERAEQSEIDSAVKCVLDELQYKDDQGNNVQSPNDNSQTFQSLLRGLNGRFTQVNLSWESSFYRNTIGGIRFEKVDDERRAAGFIKALDQYLISRRFVNPAFFYYVGQKPNVEPRALPIAALPGNEETTFFETLDSRVPGTPIDPSETRKLYLTRFSMDDLEGMHKYSKDPRLYEFFEMEPHETLEETRQCLQKLLDRIGAEKSGRKFMYWFVRRIENDEIIGSVGLVDIDFRTLSAGWEYGMSPNACGQGYILEVQALLTKYVFEDLGMARLYGVTAVGNKRTIASVQAAGFQEEGVLRNYYLFEGTMKDGIIYSLIDRDYFVLRDRRRSS